MATRVADYAAYCESGGVSTGAEAAAMAKCLLHRDGLVLLKTSVRHGTHLLVSNHRLESRMPEIGLFGSEGGAT
jgi:hypothetical protein